VTSTLLLFSSAVDQLWPPSWVTVEGFFLRYETTVKLWAQKAFPCAHCCTPCLYLPRRAVRRWFWTGCGRESNCACIARGGLPTRAPRLFLPQRSWYLRNAAASMRCHRFSPLRCLLLFLRPHFAILVRGRRNAGALRLAPWDAVCSCHYFFYSATSPVRAMRLVPCNAARPRRSCRFCYATTFALGWWCCACLCTHTGLLATMLGRRAVLHLQVCRRAAAQRRLYARCQTLHYAFRCERGGAENGKAAATVVWMPHLRGSRSLRVYRLLRLRTIPSLLPHRMPSAFSAPLLFRTTSRGGHGRLCGSYPALPAPLGKTGLWRTVCSTMQRCWLDLAAA